MPSPSLSPTRTTPTTTRSSAAPRRATLADRLALLLIQLGAFSIVLAAVPYKTFELDRHLIPKELALHIVAFSSALLCLAQRKRLELSRVDTFLVGWLALSLLSSLFATNWWLAGRYLAISVSGVTLFWTARTLAGAGLARPLLGTLAAAVVVGAVTALLQAYGVVSEFASLSRAPGGTFGNRNFMAHLSAIGLPVLILFGLQSTTKFGLRLIAVGVTIVSAALVLSRSRAAWLALGVCGFFLLWALWIIRLRHKEAWQGRPLRTMAGAAAIGAFAALVLPNTLDWKSDSPYLDSVRGVVNYKEGSGAGRLVQYSRTLEMTLEHPLFGVGPGNWSLDYPRHAPRDDPSFSRGDGTTANPWPSSDWMAWLSERGIPAMIFLGLAFFGITVGALAEWGRAKTTEQSLAATALLATLIVTVIEGAFDAVLLLPTPAFFAWTIFGALSGPSRPRAVFLLSAGKRLRAMATVALLGLLVIYRSTAQLGAMSVFSTGPDLDALEQASRIDPGNYRIHMRLAELYQSRGRCDRAKRHAQAARKLLPTAPGPRRIVAECN